jgi:hypothetical protein
MNAFQKLKAMCFKAPFSLAMCLVVFGLQAQVPEYTRHISRSFPVDKAITVEISNKYGRVQIIPWDVDSVKFNIDMRIRAKDNQKLEKMKQGVDFEFTSGQYYQVARTLFGASGSDVFKDIVDIAGSYLSTSNSVIINYTVMLPAHVALKIENKFGDVYLDDYDGPLNLALSYGDLKANRLNGHTEIKLASGDGEINYLKDGQIIISYANMHIIETLKLVAQTRSSVVTIDKSGTIKLDSRRDKLFLNEVVSLTGDCYFSKINLGNLHKELSLNSSYGDITVDGIQQSFSLINLYSELTDLTLSFEKPMQFDFELTHYQTVLFVYPKTNAKLTTKVVNAEEKLFETSGTFGTGIPDSRVVIKAPRKCNLTISQK